MKKLIAIPVFALMPFMVSAATMFPATNGSVTSSTSIDLSTYYPAGNEAVIDVSSGINLTLKNNRGSICFKIGSNTNINLNNAIFDNTYTGACALYIQGTNNTINVQGELNYMRGGASYPAIYVKPGAEVTIIGDGKITTYGGSGAAAIGSNDTYESGTIIIDGNPRILAYGGSGGAAIGGGTGQKATTISIKGGTVTANGGSGGAAGIGGGGMKSQSGAYFAGSAEYITISGGTITANGNGGGAGIGGGGKTVSSYVTSGIITSISISGGTISATGGSGGGCGIGKGSRATSSLGAISISGGRVEATGQLGGAGIGAGYLSSSPNITISGGIVFAEGSSYNSYVHGDDIGFGGDVAGGSSALTMTGSTTAVFARNNRWHSNRSATGLSYVYSKFDGLLKNTAYGYSFPAWNMYIAGPATAYGYIKQYSVYFKSNGGNSYYSLDKVSPVEDITPPTTNPTRTGYTFNNWFTESACTNLFVFLNHPITSNINIYAGWTPNQYELTFDINTGESGSMTNLSLLFDGSVDLPAGTFSKTGYTFLGWNTTANGSGKAYADLSSFTMLTEGATLYAIWDPVNYTVAFDGNTNTAGSTADQLFTYDTAQNLNINGFIKSGYTFSGWNSEAGGTGIAYSEGDSVNNLTSIEAAIVPLYAQWEINDYSITYDLNNGINDGANPDTFNVESADIILADASKEGYTFSGWYSDSAFTEELDTIARGSTGDTTLYAQFSPVSYSITYNLDNGINDGTNPDTYNIESEDILFADASKEGYTFLGWYSDTVFTEELSTIARGSTGDTTLYAQFSINTFLVIFQDWDGELIDQQSVDHGSSASVPSDTIRAGYLFEGWFTESDTLITDFNNITCNLTVNARYVIAATTENISESKVYIYPNPVAGNKLHIKAKNEIQGVRIIDIKGRVVYVNTNKSPVQTIAVEGWESGMYFIRIDRQVLKFIIK